jgi:hypothetical protein
MKALFCQLCAIAKALQFLTDVLEPGTTRDALLALVARLDGVIDAVLDASLASKEGADT